MYCANQSHITLTPSTAAHLVNREDEHKLLNPK